MSAQIRRLTRRIAGLNRKIAFRAGRTVYWKARYKAARKTAKPRVRKRLHASIDLGEDLRKQRRTLVARRERLRRQRSDAQWGGARAITNEIIDIVNGRAPITSRKRWQLFGNPGSDHWRGKKNADAVDFGIAEAHWLKNEISRRLGGPRELADYGSFFVERNGQTFRVQLIAGTHGTGPHLHAGVEAL